MKLTAEQFEQIITSLKSDGTGGTGGHQAKRRAPRVGMRATVTVVPVGGPPQARREARVRDLASDGIGLVHPDPLRPGTFFVVVLPRGTGEVLGAVYRVTHCARQADRSYSIGAKLERLVDADALRSAVA